MLMSRFRWAFCQLDALQKCLTPHATRKSLSGLPKTLDETYDRIPCSIDQEYFRREHTDQKPNPLEGSCIV
ncbi:hypothetical protein B0J14DRAFT_605694 [Halenospora varia]|nr:hypothetical protein B0J14DRAFT_605694 [Halenospora varia]